MHDLLRALAVGVFNMATQSGWNIPIQAHGIAGESDEQLGADEVNDPCRFVCIVVPSH